MDLNQNSFLLNAKTKYIMLHMVNLIFSLKGLGKNFSLFNLLAMTWQAAHPEGFGLCLNPWDGTSNTFRNNELDKCGPEIVYILVSIVWSQNNFIGRAFQIDLVTLDVVSL